MLTLSTSSVAIIGGGPAGLIAAEILSEAGLAVTVYERMPAVGRKLLMAGRGGLNLTHSEDLSRFMTRYGEAMPRLKTLIEAFDPAALRGWSEGLGQETFIGTSGRVFPKAFKASPLLRAWLARLERQGVRFALRHDWQGWDEEGRLVFVHGGESVRVRADATILALGGASWPRLGSDGRWVQPVRERGIAVTPFKPANMGFTIGWSDYFKDRFAGEPLKPLALTFDGKTVRGEAMITRDGIEGGAIYALSAPLRDAIARDGKATLLTDLRPDVSVEALTQKLSAPHKGQSTSTFLRKAAGLSPLAIALLREGGALPSEPKALAQRSKALPLVLTGVKPLDRAISSAGGVSFDELDTHLMLRRLPGVFVAGEMLDWEAPTGGYLLQATFATGIAAAKGVLACLHAGKGLTESKPSVTRQP
ncbi:TIGR03862 family flavoprotein [Microvirga sp. 2MCAF38]|uniref:TIGR03862 family flavoprotein n=1 Tax=Microvirga sp. 2MCAF38 TaxID=3232989 RepID=UPI003F956345